MTSATEAPKASFRLGMLIYDTRYRSITIQVIALVLLAVVLWWLRDNLVTNLADKGKDINFSFLWTRAGYDIDQQLISYTNDDTHSRALFIGLLNTLAVAFFGCILATIIGVFAGVLRLSKNWIVARLMTVYVEVFRNVPLLLWIILAYTVFTEIMPQVNDFKVTQAMIDSGTPAAIGFSLQSGIPYAMGIKLAKPESEVFCVTGEGSVQMCIQELSTCLQYNTPIKILSLNNRYLGMVRQWQEIEYSGRYSHSYMDALPDFVKLAEAYGHVGMLIERPEDVEPALREARKLKDRTVFMDFRTDPTENVFPMVQAGKGITEMLLSPEDL